MRKRDVRNCQIHVGKYFSTIIYCDKCVFSMKSKRDIELAFCPEEIDWSEGYATVSPCVYCDPDFNCFSFITS